MTDAVPEFPAFTHAQSYPPLGVRLFDVHNETHLVTDATAALLAAMYWTANRPHERVRRLDIVAAVRAMARRLEALELDEIVHLDERIAPLHPWFAGLRDVTRKPVGFVLTTYPEALDVTDPQNWSVPELRDGNTIATNSLGAAAWLATSAQFPAHEFPWPSRAWVDGMHAVAMKVAAARPEQTFDLTRGDPVRGGKG